MGYSFTAGPKRQRWDSFNFVSTKKNFLDIAMSTAKSEMDDFEPGGSEWADSWEDIAKTIARTCTVNRSRVAFLRMSCHGNVGQFRMGKTLFLEKNAHEWAPIVSQIAGFFVPGVSFVTIDSCKTGQGQGVLTAFSKALGGVDVRGYEDIQNKSTSEEDGRGAFVTCRVNVCTKNKGL